MIGARMIRIAATIAAAFHRGGNGRRWPLPAPHPGVTLAAAVGVRWRLRRPGQVRPGTVEVDPPAAPDRCVAGGRANRCACVRGRDPRDQYRAGLAATGAEPPPGARRRVRSVVARGPGLLRDAAPSAGDQRRADRGHPGMDSPSSAATRSREATRHDPGPHGPAGGVRAAAARANSPTPIRSTQGYARCAGTCGSGRASPWPAECWRASPRSWRPISEAIARPRC